MHPCSHYWVAQETNKEGQPVYAGFPMPKMIARCVHCEETASFTLREWHDMPMVGA